MNRVEFLSKHVFFTSRQYALATDIAIETASRQLHALSQEGAIQQVTRGIWCQTHHPFYSPHGAVPYLLDQEQGYVSFLTALHRHGVISQIPRSIQIATTGRGRRLSSPIGEFELFQMQPSLMREGIEVHSGKLFYTIASPEKALFDTLYLSTRKGRRFLRLPELELDSIDKKKFKLLLSRAHTSIQRLVTPKAQRLLGANLASR